MTTRPIAKVYVLVCTNSVLIIANNVLVRVARAYVLDELLKIKHRIFIVLPNGSAIETMNTCGPANVPITRFLS